MKLSFHGQSTIYFEANGKKVIVDPFITGNGQSDLDASTLKVDYIILTHGHGDHFGDTIELANRNHATVIGSAELGDYLTTYHNVENVRPMNIGGKAEFDFGNVKFVQAFHSSSLTDENGIPVYLGMPMGLILEIEGKTIYHTGDTGLFSDMKLIADRHPVDVCFIPIGDNFTMGIDDASYAINSFIKPKISVPIHYDTFELIEQDPNKFKEAVSVGEVQILKPGEDVSF
ncbi:MULTISPECIES: metal-dependent hydrolase [Staphylococcus]|jgi:L-ascorbate metabolism protein UlaG (beta-lactamase superfamily)|uniref:metal-dependent hydrolase n=1 Tax=Staphylococcus TaxID=1279 RepID=UPI0007D9E97C|nr:MULTISPECIES: metal-dependent hydrolase [Staphylococcus]MBC2920623.1 metal-dependent hydrolase [Staphylococcus saprophyticus]MBC2956327.1 metal-dependent hydrolase [Staphylococcus saprophyticus]MBC3009549.1 metal-dependent hydrolase [Staphylococcus saprophyticus]MBC3023428.1 metal-dependent hydrolase [Staphylococcus saprophyticus]MBC3029311.1 metal-dependent hydrolase [Staphylococcus saprophyticus]